MIGQEAASFGRRCFAVTDGNRLEISYLASDQGGAAGALD